VSQKLLEISKCAQQVNCCKLIDLQIGIHTRFRYLFRFLRYFEKKNIIEKVCQSQGVAKMSLFGSKYVKNICLNWQL